MRVIPFNQSTKNYGCWQLCNARAAVAKARHTSGCRHTRTHTCTWSYNLQFWWGWSYRHLLGKDLRCPRHREDNVKPQIDLGSRVLAEDLTTDGKLDRLCLALVDFDVNILALHFTKNPVHCEDDQKDEVQLRNFACSF